MAFSFEALIHLFELMAVKRFLRGPCMYSNHSVFHLILQMRARNLVIRHISVADLGYSLELRPLTLTSKVWATFYLSRLWNFFQPGASFLHALTTEIFCFLFWFIRFSQEMRGLSEGLKK